MITLNAVKNVDGDKEYEYEFKGLSTDQKPSSWGGNQIEVNSMFLEMDTGDFYYLKQQGSSSVEEVVYINDAVFSTSQTYSDDEYRFKFYEDEYPVLSSKPVHGQKIYVEYDGVLYECDEPFDSDVGEDYFEYYYGALRIIDPTDYTHDYSTYPFSLCFSYDGSEDEGEQYELTIYGIKGDKTNRNVSISSKETVVVEPVWEKVGSANEPEPTYEKIYELTFSDWQDDGDGSYYFDIYGSEAPSEMFPNTVTVDWDGVRYKDVEKIDDLWGAPYDNGYDFSVYPFSFQLYDVGELELHLVANSDREHTFEVYVED